MLSKFCITFKRLWKSAFGISNKKHRLKYVCAFPSHFYNRRIAYVAFMNGDRKELSPSRSSLVSIAHLSTATGLVGYSGQGTKRMVWVFLPLF